MRKFTQKEKLFCYYYLKYFNLTKAALKAGYSKYSAMDAHRFMKRPHIKEYIDKKINEKLEMLDIDTNKIFREAEIIAFSNIADYMKTEDGKTRLKDLNEIDAEKLKAVKAIERKTFQNNVIREKIVMHSKLDLIGILMSNKLKELKQINMNDEKVESVEVRIFDCNDCKYKEEK